MTRSVADFALMAHCQDDDLITCQAIQRNISTVAKVNQPLAILRLHVLHGPTDGGLALQHLDFLTNGLDGTLGCIEVVLGQEPIKSVNIAQRLR